MPIRTTLRHHWLATAVTLIVGIPIIVFLLWSTITLHYVYSRGTRAGYLQKFSRKGWLCKTWEGELQVTPVPGTVPEKFVFSARSDSIADLLNRYSGDRVVLTYEQHKGVPSSCFGDTEYYVVGVRPVT
jgi:hypothetical protein